MRAVTDVGRARGCAYTSTAPASPTRSLRSTAHPTDITWRAGADIVTLGATKNGALSTDAIVCFDPSLRESLTYRLKRAGHVASKMRFQSAQLDAYFADGLWLRLAATANDAMARLVAGLVERGLVPDHVPRANMVFLRADPAVSTPRREAGLDFYRLTKDRVRFVTSFRSTPEEIDEVLRRMDERRPFALA